MVTIESILINKWVVLVELDYHAEVVEGFIEFAKKWNTKLTLFLEHKVYSKIHLNYRSNNEIICIDSKNLDKYLSKYEDTLENCDFIILNTIDNQPKNLLKFSVYFNKTIVRLHNVNNNFFSLKNVHIPDSFFLLWKEISFLIRIILFQNSILCQKKIINECKYLLLPSNPLTEYALRISNLNKDKFLAPLPFYPEILIDVYGYVSNILSKKDLTIVIPGKVDSRRRCYDWVLDLFPSELLNNFKIQLILLGNSNTYMGRKIIKLFKKKHPGLIYFNSFVSAEEYEKYMTACDFILSPLKQKVIFGIVNEYYGLTKYSGALSDSYKFKKVIIGPDSIYSKYPNTITFKPALKLNFFEVLEDFLHRNQMT